MFFLKINDNYIVLEKAKNLTKLIKKVIINKKGQQQTVYIKPDVDVFKMKEDQINKFIESIRNEKIEHSLTVNNKGEVLVYKIGKENQVRYTQQELRKINGAKLSIHNHPIGNSLSPTDVNFSIINDIKEIKVVGLFDNKKVNYSFKIKKTILKEEIESFQREYNKTSSETYFDLKNKIYTNEITSSDASNNFFHYVLNNFTNKFKDRFSYERQ